MAPHKSLFLTHMSIVMIIEASSRWWCVFLGGVCSTHLCRDQVKDSCATSSKITQDFHSGQQKGVWAWKNSRVNLYGQDWRWHLCLPPSFHWLHLSHMTTPSCMGGWEMYSIGVPGQGSKADLGKQVAVSATLFLHTFLVVLMQHDLRSVGLEMRTLEFS